MVCKQFLMGNCFPQKNYKWSPKIKGQSGAAFFDVRIEPAIQPATSPIYHHSPFWHSYVETYTSKHKAKKAMTSSKLFSFS